jgi:protein-tyrosine phosphatase
VLAKVSLGSGRHVLLESPYGRRAVDIESIIGGLTERGYGVILAHPERCPLFQRDADRLARLVDKGVMCSITSGSMSGRFGAPVRRFTVEILRRGLVHDVASDAHDHVHRPPGLVAGFADVEEELPGISAHAAWYTVTAPVAILAGKPLPAMPELEGPKSTGVRRLLGRRRR